VTGLCTCVRIDLLDQILYSSPSPTLLNSPPSSNSQLPLICSSSPRPSSDQKKQGGAAGEKNQGGAAGEKNQGGAAGEKNQGGAHDEAGLDIEEQKEAVSVPATTHGHCH
jgi:hypothetical protein